jgi:antitoxin ParD1/3/4
MRTTRQLSVTLPIKMADMVRESVESGEYASESEVVREGLRALQERKAVVERWLREEVVPTAIAYDADPNRGIPAEQILDRVNERRRAKGRAKAG